MSPSLSQVCWAIESVIVNSETLLDYEGFEKLQTGNNQIAILPAGLEFKVVECKSQGLILDSQGQRYFGQISQSGASVQLQLNRPQFAETIVINGRLSTAGSDDSVSLGMAEPNVQGNNGQREVVQV